MNFNLLQDKILNNKFSIGYKKAVELVREKKVEIVDIKEINEVTNIYGRVIDGPRKYNTHIRIRNNFNSIQFSCNCDVCEEARRMGVQFPCQHIVSVALKVLEKRERGYRKKEKINFIVRLEESFSKEYKYNASIILKDKGIIKISNNEELEYNIFSRRAVYSLERIEYSSRQKKILKILRKINFKIKDEDLREVLFICKNNDNVIKIDFIEYENSIVDMDIPLRFTLKKEEERIKLQRTKSSIKALNKEGTVFIYDRKIYIPPFNKCRAYFPIYKALEKKSYTYIKESSLEKVIKVLDYIGELVINDEIKNLIAENTKLILYFYKDKEEIKCSFKIDKDHEYLRKSAKVKIIEEILFQNRFTKKEGYYSFLGDDYELLEFLKSNIINYCDIKTSKSLGSLKILSIKDIESNVQGKNNLNLQVNIDGVEDEEIMSAIDSFNSGESFYKFKNNSFLDFSSKEINEFMNILSFIDYKGNGSILPMGYEEVIEKVNGVNFIDIIEKNNYIYEETLKKPRGLKADLRSYQQDGVKWMQNKKEQELFGILADEMGLGKTLQAISFLLLNKNKRKTSLVVTETSLVYNWEAEFKKFAPSLEIGCAYGSKSKREKILKNLKDYHIILTSYGTLNMDIERYKEINFENFIIDEAQNIKNSKSKITQNIKAINAKTKFALTGTPIENNLLELWSIFDFLKPGYLFSESEFKRKFKNISEENLNYLRLIVKPFILRRVKKDVLKDIPEKQERIFFISMTEKQKRFYKSNLNSYKKMIDNTSNNFSILSILTRLRQIVLDPYIVDETYEGDSAKIDATIELVKKFIDANNKTLIFSQFTSMLDRLKEKLDKLNIKYYYLDGSTKASERLELCNKFNESEEIKLFLISLKAGGTGLNLTSAEKVIHFDPWWNPAVENQATDRAHRIGQKNQVEVIKLITKGTIEENILKLKEKKESIVHSLLGDEDNQEKSMSILSKEEIEYLLTYNE
ncbi:MAG: DEAD/DEAH box helicase [Clostridium sp.]|nr:DEAD/DEAH box helicase [Clostridium sp.]